VHSGAIDTAVQTTLSNIFANSKLYAKKLFPVYQGPRGNCLMKKNRGRKSRDMAPLQCRMLAPAKRTESKGFF
jgi:hypothetical protein